VDIALVRRDSLIHLLTEAAEIEHNLLCSYLYAAFSLKSSAYGGLSAEEQKTVDRWRKTLTGIAIEEMAHLALVNNLLVTVGGAPRFDRPNFPVPPGYHPAGFVIRLAPLTRETLDHFIFLERPSDAGVSDGPAYRPQARLTRTQTPGDFTPSTPDYETIGDFYAEIRTCMEAFAKHAGSRTFVSSEHCQLTPDIADLPGLIAVRTLDDALTAIDTIVEQGEGSSCAKENCHFSRFRRIDHEWAALTALNPDFAPAHPAATDPVMRRPAEGLQRVWITHPDAARLLDLANALYGFLLVLLENVYGGVTHRGSLVRAAVALMHPLAQVGAMLARLPSGEQIGIHAGMTFAVPRNLRRSLAFGDLCMVAERIQELRQGAAGLGLSDVVEDLIGIEAGLSPAGSKPASSGSSGRNAPAG
jgi:Ferritin-like